MSTIKKLAHNLRNHWKLVSVVLVIFLIGFSVVRSRASSSVTTYESISAKKQDIQQTFSVSGKVTAFDQANLHFQTIGRLTYLKVKEGDMVRKGQVLATLDTSSLQTAVTNAEFNWYAADAAAKKAEDDVKGHSGDETFAQRQTRVSAQTARDSAYFSWQQAKQNLINAYLVAPFNGVVADINNMEVGSNTGADSGIVVLDPKSIYFSGDLDETDLAKVKTGQTVLVRLDAFPDNDLTATVSAISLTPKTGVTGTVYDLKVPLQSTEKMPLRLGMNGDAELVLSEKKDVLVLPIEAINLQRDDQGKVLVKEGNQMKTISVRTGIIGDKYVEITDGINESTQVYVAKTAVKSK